MKRIEPTIVEKATQTVDGFAKVYKLLQQQVVLRGQSKSTLENYIRRIALISLHFGRLPQDISEEEINEYLAALASNPQKPSRSIVFYYRSYTLPG
jgi:integrase/recombinase XerD